MVHANREYREKQNKQERQRAGCRFEGPPDHDAPLAAGEMLQHQQAERTQGESENQHVAHQIGAEKSVLRFRIAQPEEASENQSDGANGQSRVLQAVDALRSLVFLRGHFAESPWESFSRNSAGNSETCASRLSCSART